MAYSFNRDIQNNNIMSKGYHKFLGKKNENRIERRYIKVIR